MEQGMGTVGNIIVLVYLIVIFAIGVYAKKFTKNFNDYILGGGKTGIVLLAGTVIATLWGGVTFLGIAGYSYTSLYKGVWYAFGAFLFFLVWAFFLAKPIRKMQPYTISEWFALRYDKKCGLLASLFNLIVYLGFLGSQFVAFATVVNSLMGWPFEWSIVISAVVVTAYTFVGGFFAVAMTDLVQFAISLVGALIILIVAIANVGTFGAVREALPPEYFNSQAPWGIFYMVTIFFLWLGAHPLQHITQRISSASTKKIAFWAAVFGALGYLFVTYVTPAVGAYARVILPGLERADQAYPMLVMTLLPTWAAALVVAALLAVVMSSADSYLLGPATLAASDVIRYFKPDIDQKKLLLAARLMTVVYAGLALIVALSFKVIIAQILTFLVIAWAMLPALYASVTWKKASNTAAFWSMLIGAGVNVVLIKNVPAAMQQYPSYYTGCIGFAVAIVLLIVLTLIFPKKEAATA